MCTSHVTRLAAIRVHAWLSFPKYRPPPVPPRPLAVSYSKAAAFVYAPPLPPILLVARLAQQLTTSAVALRLPRFLAPPLAPLSARTLHLFAAATAVKWRLGACGRSARVRRRTPSARRGRHVMA
jgi:hypothetical protein